MFEAALIAIPSTLWRQFLAYLRWLCNLWLSWQVFDYYKTAPLVHNCRYIAIRSDRLNYNLVAT